MCPIQPWRTKLNRVFFQLSAWKTVSVLMMTVAPVVAETSQQNIGEISELGGSVLAGPTFSGLKVMVRTIRLRSKMSSRPDHARTLWFAL